MTDSKDTQEEKSQPDRTILPSCLNLDVNPEEQEHERAKNPKGNVVLYCTKMPKKEGPGETEEEPSCPRYSCKSGPTQQDCSDIDFTQTYSTVPCPKEGQKPRKRHKCGAKSVKKDEKIDFCCPVEVLEHEDIENFPVTENPQLSATDLQETVGDHQTPKTPRDHQTSRRKIRISQERRDLAYSTPAWYHPTPINTQLCLGIGLGYQPPGLGQQSSQGWVIAAGAAGAAGAVVGLVLGVRWWKGRRAQRGWREKWRLCKKVPRAEEGLREELDGDGDGETTGCEISRRFLWNFRKVRGFFGRRLWDFGRER